MGQYFVPAAECCPGAGRLQTPERDGSLCHNRKALLHTIRERDYFTVTSTKWGGIIALLSFLGPRKISSKLCPKWRAKTPSRQLEAVLKDSQLSLCAAQPQQGNAANPPLQPPDSSSFQAFLKEAAVRPRDWSLRGSLRLTRADRSMKQKSGLTWVHSMCPLC